MPPLPDMGRRRSWYPITSANVRASQKLGVETKIEDIAMANLSAREYRFTAEMVPAGIATDKPMIMADIANMIVLGSLLKISMEMGLPVLIFVPRSS
jgi:hypothetical protein